MSGENEVLYSEYKYLEGYIQTCRREIMNTQKMIMEIQNGADADIVFNDAIDYQPSAIISHIEFMIQHMIYILLILAYGSRDLDGRDMCRKASEYYENAIELHSTKHLGGQHADNMVGYWFDQVSRDLDGIYLSAVAEYNEFMSNGNPIEPSDHCPWTVDELCDVHDPYKLFENHLPELSPEQLKMSPYLQNFPTICCYNSRNYNKPTCPPDVCNDCKHCDECIKKYEQRKKNREES